MQQKTVRQITPALLILLAAGFLTQPPHANGELFTALAEMEELLDTEAVLIANLEGYIQVQSEKLEFLKKKVGEYQKEHSEAAVDISTYVSNPINAYLLTKRMTTDWKEVETMMAFEVGKMFLDNVTEYRSLLKFPSEEDLNGAAVALMRLQDTYKLDTASVARGELNGVHYSTEMTAEDCFELGRQSYLNHDYYHTTLWMREAMSRHVSEMNTTEDYLTNMKADILEYLAFSTYKQGDIYHAMRMTKELLELNPGHERAMGNLAVYEKEVSRNKIVDPKLKGDDGSPGLEHLAEKLVVGKKPKFDPNTYTYSERTLYEMLCRSEIIPDPAELKDLSCWYVHDKSPFLRIAPLKVELAHRNPYIFIYHEVMSDTEIELVKKMAKPRFRRATVQNHKTGKLEVAHYRISKSAWLKDEEHEIVRNIGLRVEDMTGLTISTAEELQVVNYGIGGHYEPHFDFARKEEREAFKSLGTGNRIATVLFYMSDVAQGGATVFPSIKLALTPKKGTAAFWMNLHASGEGDYLTRHAACPVLAGSKWVSNKWLHERGQEHQRPCELEPDHPL